MRDVFLLLRSFFLLSIVVSAISLSAQSSLRAQIASASFRREIVPNIVLNGTIDSYTSDQQDSGTATLSASSDGSYQVSFQLNSGGFFSESRNGPALNSTCTWSDSSQTQHEIPLANCWKPLVWFLPSLGLASSQTYQNISLQDLGVEASDNETSSRRNIHAETMLSAFPQRTQDRLKNQMGMELSLDPSSLLPSMLAYYSLSDKGESDSLKYEIHFSKYQSFEGVAIPMHIERYLNGAIQLSMDITTVSIN